MAMAAHTQAPVGIIRIGNKKPDPITVLPCLSSAINSTQEMLTSYAFASGSLEKGRMNKSVVPENGIGLSHIHLNLVGDFLFMITNKNHVVDVGFFS